MWAIWQVLADVVEALICAYYQSGGPKLAKLFMAHMGIRTLPGQYCAVLRLLVLVFLITANRGSGFAAKRACSSPHRYS